MTRRQSLMVLVPAVALFTAVLVGATSVTPTSAQAQGKSGAARSQGHPNVSRQGRAAYGRFMGESKRGRIQQRERDRPVERRRYEPTNWYRHTDEHRRHYWYPYGHVIPSLPHGHSSLMFGDSSFFFFSGVYYRPAPRGYVVVAPPPGIGILALPHGYVTVYLGPQPYYYYYGTYYRWNPGLRRYLVVTPPIGVTVPYLPPGYATIVRRGHRYYRYGGADYRPYFHGGTLVYITVRL